MTILDPLDVRVRIEELKPLREGWLDGKGVPPSREGLDWLADAFDLNYPEDLPLPYLFPTSSGKMLAEWSLKPWSPTVEIDLATKQGLWHSLNLDTDVESSKVLNLSHSEDWKQLADEIRAMIGEAA